MFKDLKFSHILPASCLVLPLLFTYSTAQAEDLEKCYGIAKAGLNDCDAGATNCDKSVIDADPNYWMYVPKGMCDKIVGGLLMGGVPGGSMQTMPTMPSTAPATAPAAPTTTPPAPSPSVMPMPGVPPDTTTPDATKSGAMGY